MDTNAKFSTAGHLGFVGSAILRGLQTRGTTSFALRTHAKSGLDRQAAVWMQDLLACSRSWSQASACAYKDRTKSGAFPFRSSIGCRHVVMGSSSRARSRGLQPARSTGPQSREGRPCDAKGSFARLRRAFKKLPDNMFICSILQKRRYGAYPGHSDGTRSLSGTKT